MTDHDTTRPTPGETAEQPGSQTSRPERGEVTHEEDRGSQATPNVSPTTDLPADQPGETPPLA